MSKSARKLKIEIVVPVEALDFIEAANHQNRLSSYFSRVSERYESSTFRLIERRGRGLRDTARSAQGIKSGKLNDYD